MKGAKLKKQCTIEGGKGKSGGGENKNCTSTRKQKFNKKTKKKRHSTGSSETCGFMLTN